MILLLVAVVVVERDVWSRARARFNAVRDASETVNSFSCDRKVVALIC